jgi:hypothetical protein
VQIRPELRAINAAESFDLQNSLRRDTLPIGHARSFDAEFPRQPTHAKPGDNALERYVTIFRVHSHARNVSCALAMVKRNFVFLTFQQLTHKLRHTLKIRVDGS